MGPDEPAWQEGGQQDDRAGTETHGAHVHVGPSIPSLDTLTDEDYYERDRCRRPNRNAIITRSWASAAPLRSRRSRRPTSGSPRNSTPTGTPAARSARR